MEPIEPGTELKNVLEDIGVYAENCDCKLRVEMMNKWGLEECLKPERFNEIVDWLKDENKKREWWKRFLPTLRAMSTRLALNPANILHPEEAIVREALRRAQEKASQQTPSQEPTS